MKTENEFIIEISLNNKGNELIDAYNQYHKKETNETVKKALKLYVQHEHNIKIANAFLNDNYEDFETLVYSYAVYKKSDKDYIKEASVFVENNIDFEAIKATMKTSGNKIIVIKKIGIKQAEVESIFGVDKLTASKLMKNDFIKTFVDTYIRKYINDCMKDFKYTYEIGEVYKVENRNLYDIDLRFIIKPTKLNKEICSEIQETISKIKQPIEFLL